MKTYQLFILLIISVACATNKSNQKTDWVYSSNVQCESVEKMKFLQVQKSDTSNRENLYSPIEGFDFESG